MRFWPDELVPPPLRPRLVSIGLDYLVIACWIAVITVAGLVVRPALPAPGGADAPTAAVRADAVAFMLTVLPAWLYFTLTEAGRRHGSLGKRTAGLRVVTADGSNPSWARVAGRNAVKLAPWQVAHLAVARFMLGTGYALAITAYVAALALVVLTVVMAVRDPLRRGLHDRLAGTRVVLDPGAGGVA